MSDLISRQAAIRDVVQTATKKELDVEAIADVINVLEHTPSAEPEIIRCKDCKHNPKDEWFGCPMSHLSEAQRPETAWCWKAERRTDDE